MWVNDAMATVFARFIDTEPEEFKRATEVTYLGAVYGTMVALTTDDRARPGKIVQVGSALAYRAIPLQAAYCGAKFAIRGFTDSIRTELRHDKSKVQITMVQLPGVNTTQFNWCRSKLPDHPMPVPPIYQPEIPAEAVYWAAHHRRRELWVGYSAVEAILGSTSSRRACSATGISQGPASPASRSRTCRSTASASGNLFEPVEGEAATHGIFDAQAKTRSPQLWAATHRGAARRRSRRSGCRGSGRGEGTGSVSVAANAETLGIRAAARAARVRAARRR